MLPKIQLGMTEYSSRRSRPRSHILCILLSWTFLISFILFRNYQFFSSGLLRPNFHLIHEAYVFNLSHEISNELSANVVLLFDKLLVLYLKACLSPALAKLSLTRHKYLKEYSSSERMEK